MSSADGHRVEVISLDRGRGPVQMLKVTRAARGGPLLVGGLRLTS